MYQKRVFILILILIFILICRNASHGKWCTSSDFDICSLLYFLNLQKRNPRSMFVPAAIFDFDFDFDFGFNLQKRDPRQMVYQQRCADEEAEKVAKKKQQEIELRRLREARMKKRENKNKLISLFAGSWCLLCIFLCTRRPRRRRKRSICVSVCISVCMCVYVCIHTHTHTHYYIHI